MAREPIHLELAGGKSQRQRIWELIREHFLRDAQFNQKDVTPGGVPNDTANDYLRGLARAGILKVVRAGHAPRVITIYRLNQDLGAEAPRVNRRGEIVTQGNGNEAIWSAMQALGSFTARVLAKMSGAKENTVKTYCIFLARAGYLTVEREGGGRGRGGVESQYRLLRSKISGPRPPMITRLKAVYDPNTHDIVWQQTADDAAEELDK